ncbi:MAG TPA: hypothetical protein DDZ34_02320 [Syntrophaceae bacterium]|nr:hypothetical protein [Syntrophaceae bacterium]
MNINLNNININTLYDFMHKFYGYGNLNAKFWFIGMEEGGGNDIDELHKRISAWNENGKKLLEDVVSYHIHIGMPHFFEKNGNKKVRIQRTWGQLIRILLLSKGINATMEHIRAYQTCSLGRADDHSETCLMELMPLPSSSTNDWIYGQFQGIETRVKYFENISPHRINKLKELINENPKKIILFYGKSYIDRWRHIIGSDLKVDNGFMWFKKNSLFIVINHPCRISNEYCQNVATFIMNSIGW